MLVAYCVEMKFFFEYICIVPNFVCVAVHLVLSSKINQEHL